MNIPVQTAKFHPAAWAGAFLTVFLGFLLGCNNTELSPDGWAYWEGSVSLLTGRGYRYFGGTPIIHWPPGFPLWLSFWQALLGVAASSISIASILTCSAGALIWTQIICIISKTTAFDIGTWIQALLISLVFAHLSQPVLSEPLALLLFGFLVLEAVRTGPIEPPMPGTAHPRQLLPLFLTALAIEPALLLVRNVSIALLPVCAWFNWRKSSAFPFRNRALVAFIPPVVAMVVWQAVRVVLHQTASHPADAEKALYGPGSYLMQSAIGIGRYFGPGRAAVAGWIWLIPLTLVFGSLNPSNPLPRSTLGPGALRRVDFGIAAVLHAGILTALFSMTYVYDSPADARFAAPSALLLYAGLARQRAVQHPAVIVLTMALCGLALIAKLNSFAARLHHRAGLKWIATVDPEWYDRTNRLSGNVEIISPPNYPGLRRQYSR